MMDKTERSAMVKALSTVVRDVVSRAVLELSGRLDSMSRTVSGFSARLDSLEQRLKEMPDPPKGDKGDTGERGRDVDMDVVQAMVDGFLSNIPIPKDGIDGKDAEPVDVDSLVELISSEVKSEVAKIPPPKDGIDGKDGESIVGPAGTDGRDGKDADPIEIARLVTAEVQKAVSALPRPIDGKDGASGRDGKDAEPIHPDTIALLVTEEVRRVMAAIPKAIDGKDGEPGRDAIQIEPLPAIDPMRSYPRGTYAKYAGGLIRAFRNTDAINGEIEKAGWEVITEGYPETSHEQDPVDPRIIWAVSKATSGNLIRTKFIVPSMIYQKVYSEGTSYQKGDVVTWGGSAWHCEVATKAKPGTSTDWLLMVKEGRAGKDGKDSGPTPPESKVVRLK